MLYYMFAESSFENFILEFIDYLSIGIEVLAVILIAVAIVATTLDYVYGKFKRVSEEDRYRKFRIGLGRSLLLGLEILIAADIVRTVALEATLESVAILALLVVVRTFLSWSLVVEIEERWPWQERRKLEGE